jgi:hypothetical protein
MSKPARRGNLGYGGFGLSAAALCLTFLLIVNVANAQQAQAPPESIREPVLYFYKDPRPERLVGFVQMFASQAPPDRWDPYPPIAGLLAFVFRANPDWIDRLIPAQLDAKTAPTIAAALRLAGNTAKLEGLRPHLEAAGTDRMLAHEFAGLPSRLEDLHISTATHLDLLWGASFASGNARYVQMIIDFLAQTANRSELVALDTAQVALVMAGGPQERMPKLREKYGYEQGRQIILAATALWALQSNARQHEFIGQAARKYVYDRAGTHAAKALGVFLAPRAGERNL